ncbi:hypothetical protein [Paenibacillus macerans]|uniref:hypothetical protein n=1 Tax=Paenibacillus macerans TaxID=44252 RepID=UPI003D3132A3
MARYDEDKTSADFEYERYELLKEYRSENDIPDDDLLHHDTRMIQGISEDDRQSEGLYDTLPDVPDADAVQKDSPVDPAAPDPDAMHGTDLINGFDGDETE